MKFLFYIIIFNIIIPLIFSKMTLSNFSQFSENLLFNNNSSKNITSYTEEINNITFEFIKEFKKEGDTITALKYIQINNNTIKPGIEAEEIDSFFYSESSKSKYFICPTGNNSLLKLKLNESSSSYEKVMRIAFNSEWDLKCFYFSDLIYNVYLNLNNRIIINGYNTTSNANKLYMSKGKIFDFIEIKNNGMYGLFQNKSKLILTKFDITNGEIFDNQESKKLIDIRKFTYAYFDNNNTFYYFSCNNLTDFSSGYCHLKKNNFENETIGNIDVVNNSSTPFPKNETFTIKTIKFIRKTKYVYYIITNNTDTFYGIIDLEKNKIIFNTNENITDFKPLTNDSMQAILNSSLYQIKINININDSENKESNNKKKKKKKYPLWFIIASAEVLIILILIAILSKYIYKLYKKKRNDSCIERIYLEINDGRSTLNE